MTLDTRGSVSRAPSAVPFFRSLRWRLPLVGFGMWGITIAFLAAGAIGMQGVALEAQAQDRLNTVTRSRALALRSLIDQGTRQAEAVSQASELVDGAAGRRRLPTADWLRTRVIHPVIPILELTVTDVAGYPTLSTGDPGDGAVQLPAAHQTTYFAPPPGNAGTPYYEVVTPIRDNQAGGTTIGWLRAQFDVSGLYSVLLDRTDLGTSGEVYLVGREGQILSPLRSSDTDGARRLRIAAVLGEQGNEALAAHITGYAHDQIMGGAAIIPALGWLVVAEIDRAEALAPVRELTRTTLRFILAAAFFGAAAAVAVTVRIVRPLWALSHTATEIAAGHWERRVPVKGSDELAAMSAAFNRMADTVLSALARERAEKEAQARLAAVLEATTDFVGIVDAEQRVLFVNGAGRRMLAISPDNELDGLPMPLPVAPWARDLIMDIAVPAAVRDGVWTGETALLSRSGREVPVSQVIIAHKGPDGSVESFATIAHDISERKRMEDALRSSEARLAGMLNIAPDAVVATDEQRRIVLFNAAAEQLFGYAATDILGQPLDLLVPEELRAVHREHVAAFIRSGAATRRMADRGGMPIQGMRRSGEHFPAEAAISKIELPGGTILISILRDVTERVRAQEALRASEEQFRNAFENAPIGMALVGTEGGWIEVNGALCAMLARTPTELLETTLPESIYPDDALRYDEQVRRLLRKQIPSFQIEVRCLDVAGNDVYVLLSVSPIHDAAGDPVYLIAQFQNISELKRYQAQLVHLADHDPLTDLFNRRRFQAELERELARARRPGTRGAVMFLDLDHFKDVNDTLGHRSGDELLRSLGAMLRERLRKTDILARLGGDEFGILLPNTDAEQAQVLAEHLLLSLRHHSVLVGGKAIGATASGGIAVYPDHGLTVDEIVTHADLAMYQAKENGRNGCRVYTVEPGRQAEFELRLGQEQRIRQALEEDLFLLYAQPILALATRQVSQYELLLRLPNADGQVPPSAAFLHVAERCGLIQDIDRWVLRRAIGLLAELQAAGAGLTLEVNLSGRAFADSKLLAMIQDELAASGINPRSLVLEITETAAIADIHQAREFIHTLKGLGCRFAIDDFGVGFSSFDYLKHLPVDYLKIDGSFVRNLLHDPVDQHLVRSMAQVAAGLGMQTIAEYVGDDDTLELLMQYGVDYAQGFHIGRPQPVAQLLVPILGGPKPVV